MHHPASSSIKSFGLYVVLNGIGLAVAPALLLSPLGIAPPTEIWVRVLGIIAIVLGYYYWECGRSEVVEFFRASVRGRILFAALTVVLVAAFAAPVQILLFGMIDLAGAAWTARGLREAALPH